MRAPAAPSLRDVGLHCLKHFPQAAQREGGSQRVVSMRGTERGNGTEAGLDLDRRADLSCTRDKMGLLARGDVHAEALTFKDNGDNPTDQASVPSTGLLCPIPPPLCDRPHEMGTCSALWVKHRGVGRPGSQPQGGAAGAFCTHGITTGARCMGLRKAVVPPGTDGLVVTGRLQRGFWGCLTTRS